ncbi:MAG: hypothetical protein A2287_09500 [Candidatus Melainabacteria bacterium RIFOXYA12_FULL_32_12]|nr:MAG: hypothetical protein A2104_09450 [Candidatus Melainabacteria bacterium GWF2_32_7]OGI17468.1 MAG: hypothetical protein A2255_08360 [Candidatus Melainabacteria bacterium RIFOXYA2_FULL_32_9]OGI26491.1 MAG: hypothetical protein A2287_09500 [Candidatus Melainabacteria bacterium RIFOXYA12_FULL_32_12]
MLEELDKIDIEEDQILKKIGLELMFSNPQRRERPEGTTAIELSRKLNIKMEIVKKKLRILQDKGLIRSIGINPKYWEFNDYNFQRMDENDSVYLLLCSFEDVDFDQYFNY